MFLWTKFGKLRDSFGYEDSNKMTEQAPERMVSRSLLVVFVLSLIVLVVALVVFVLNNDDAAPTSADNADSVAVVEVGNDGAGTSIDPPQPISDFTMTANNGEELSLSDLEGQYVLLSFGYTHCPDVCPATLLNFRRIKQELGADASGVEFMFISVDAERDTPEVLDRYMQRYDPEFIGLSGEEDVLNSIRGDFNLFWEFQENPNSAAGYLVTHTASKFLIDPQGRLIRIYSFLEDNSAIVEDIQGLL